MSPRVNIGSDTAPKLVLRDSAQVATSADGLTAPLTAP
ncbi:hypothetical protein SAMN05421748_105204 [Paractinoplanes atraurantiacus]|uniref:Uncharacterized protein n=1 Tax=Paractinoplanes atraurantiacus TaxID=1036182 RepID=A0A285HRT8_9ACTN|nr:hypothetical protein SAMN05421748_105204 [Actinoplanes atraurantiacus]